jgi:hypothetical protein
MLALALLAAAALCATMILGEASAAKLVGKDGRVYACYKAKGKSKGAVRLVAKKGKCHKGEKKVSWGATATGPSGENGQNGENGVAGEGGAGGEKGTTAVQGLEKQVQSLTSKLTSLESVLKGVTNADLLGALGKLQGVSGAGLQEAVAKVPVVNTLCEQSSKLTSQSNSMGEAVEGISLVGVTLLELLVPQLPAALPKFSC